MGELLKELLAEIDDAADQDHIDVAIYLTEHALRVAKLMEKNGEII